MKFLLVALLLLQQENKPGQKQVDQKKVDEAIDKAAKYLLGRADKGLPEIRHTLSKNLKHREIVLYALVYAGVDESNATFKKLLDEVLSEPLETTYGCALQAMALEALDRTKYQSRLVQCAQFLVDNQCKTGQWSYGQKIEQPKLTATDSGKPAKDPNSSGTRAMPKIKIKPGKGVGPEKGDNSNTQYAILGIRACICAGIDFPAGTLALAENWWATTQNKDGGWDYRYENIRIDHSYGNMTAGAVGSLCILKFYTNRKFKDDPSVVMGVKWIADNFSVKEHPKFDYPSPPDHWYYYWLYALERVGMLCGLEKIGGHAWYPEGAEKLLGSQKADGAWSDAGGDPISETAFGILFLARATKPLKPVVTESSSSPKK